MTKPASEAPAAEPDEPKKADQLSEQQLDDVSGGAGRPVNDCEGTAFLTSRVFGSPSSPKLKLPE